MPDATPDLPEGEKLPRALIHSLRTCLIWSRERAAKIACLDLENYRDYIHDLNYQGYSRDPDKDEILAQVYFDDDVDHAEEVLEWRAIVMADLVGEAMSSYARAHSPIDDPWMAWRREPPVVPAAEF